MTAIPATRVINSIFELSKAMATIHRTAVISSIMELSRKEKRDNDNPQNGSHQLPFHITEEENPADDR
jgi:hypothetical protein